MADVSFTVDPVIGTAATAIAAAIGWFVRELVNDRRTQTKILGGIAATLAILEERTRWMVEPRVAARLRRPTPLDEILGSDGAAPEHVDQDVTPAPGLREVRERTRTPPGGVEALRGRYHHRGRRGPPDE